jgi:outer membrane protein assembly factor BamB
MRYCAIFVFALAPAAIRAADATDAHWPHWRGPGGDGIARSSAPVQFTDKSIGWKAEIPGRGHSTPVVWGDRIFVTTAIPNGAKPAAEPAPEPAGPPDKKGGRRRGGFGGGSGPQQEHRLEVICLDRKDGKVLWRQTAKAVVPHEGYHGQYGSFASNSPITDGKRVYVSFGSRGVYAYDFNGKLVWQKDSGVQMHMRNAFGEGVAPVLHGETLLVLFDQESDSFLLALDKNTGKELWRAQRDEISNWAEPLVVDFQGKKQVIVAAPKKVRSYNFADGKLIWECAGLGANTIPIPVYANGMVYVMSGFRDPNLMAIKLGRTGDLTGTDAIVWQNQRGNSYTPSPILKDGKLFFLTDSGMVSLLNAANGEAYYRQVRLPKAYNFKASPVLAGDKVYLAAEDGDVIVLKWAETMEVVATNTMPDEFFVASPVVLNGELLLRGRNVLYCVR